MVGPVRSARKADALIAAATAKLKQEQKAAAPAAPTEEAEAAPAATTEAVAAPAVVVPAETASDAGSPLLWVVIGVLALALLGAMAYVVKLRRGDDPRRPAGEVW